MKDFLFRLHGWQMNTVLPETTWSFPLLNGYASFDRELSSKVAKVSKWRFTQPFDYSFSWKPYGYWDSHEVFIRSRSRPKGLLSLLGSARKSHFEGTMFRSDEGARLVGSYKLAGGKRVAILMLIYVPVLLLLYGLFIFPLLVGQHLRTGDYDALLMDSVMFPAVLVASMLFWAVGYGMGRLHEATTKADREIIHDLLTRASQ